MPIMDITRLEISDEVVMFLARRCTVAQYKNHYRAVPLRTTVPEPLSRLFSSDLGAFLQPDVVYGHRIGRSCRYSRQGLRLD